MSPRFASILNVDFVIQKLEIPTQVQPSISEENPVLRQYMPPSPLRANEPNASTTLNEIFVLRNLSLKASLLARIRIRCFKKDENPLVGRLLQGLREELF